MIKFHHNLLKIILIIVTKISLHNNNKINNSKSINLNSKAIKLLEIRILLTIITDFKITKIKEMVLLNGIHHQKMTKVLVLILISRIKNKEEATKPTMDLVKMILDLMMFKNNKTLTNNNKIIKILFLIIKIMTTKIKDLIILGSTIPINNNNKTIGI